MDITFKFIGLSFEADVFVDGEYVEFLTLTCGGQDASFLAGSTLLEDLEDAAFDALSGMGHQLAQQAAAERAAEDELFSGDLL